MTRLSRVLADPEGSGKRAAILAFKTAKRQISQRRKYVCSDFENESVEYPGIVRSIG